MSRDYKIGDENNKKPQAESLRQVGEVDGKLIIDTLNISKEYQATPSLFTKREWVLNSLLNSYKKSTGIDVSKGKENNIRFFFITTIDVPADNIDKVVGGKAYEKKGIGALFNKGGLEELAHEVGHLLNLHHTFEGDNKGSTTIIIPEGKTQNYMDYSTGRNMFFLYQWIKVKVYEQKSEKND